MRFIDSHCHLADAVFDADREEVLERAAAAGATTVVCIGASIADAERARELAARYPIVRWTAGIHPQDAASFDAAKHIPALAAFLDAGAVAVGECGLDYHYDDAPRDRQRDAFSAQIDLAAHHRRPVVVHTREAEVDTGEMLDVAARAGVTGVLHCYTGTTDLARRALDAGWYVSFSGIVTFKNWTDLKLLRLVPDDRLLVESDAPYLAPAPRRGKRNEPAWVAHTIERVAIVRASDAQALGEQCRQNAMRFYSFCEDATRT